jgi:hypothetical protein
MLPSSPNVAVHYMEFEGKFWIEEGGNSNLKKKIIDGLRSLQTVTLEDYLLLVSTAVKPSNKIRNCDILLVRSCTNIYTYHNAVYKGLKFSHVDRVLWKLSSGFGGGGD